LRQKTSVAWSRICPRRRSKRVTGARPAVGLGILL
jgi:hypothetical protein